MPWRYPALLGRRTAAARRRGGACASWAGGGRDRSLCLSGAGIYHNGASAHLSEEGGHGHPGWPTIPFSLSSFTCAICKPWEERKKATPRARVPPRVASNAMTQLHPLSWRATRLHPPA